MDETLLAGVRRYWTRAQVETAHRQVLEAYANAATREVAITGNQFDGGGASGMYVLDRAAMREWMDVLESRLAEYEAAAAGESGVVIAGSPVVNFSTRRVGT